MQRETFPVGVLGCNCSILFDEHTRQALVVDPGDDLPRILRSLQVHDLKLQAIVVTHAHIDHIAGALTLKNLTGAPVLYSQRDLPLVAMMSVQADWLGVPTPQVAPPDDNLVSGRTLSFGAARAEVIETPGHTQGSLCLHLPAEELLLAGDTLFRDSVGRTDLPGGDHTTLIHSIRESLLTLPDATVVVPGHGDETSIGRERERNPFLRLV